MGMEPSTLQLIGVIELIAVVLFTIPRTGIVGTLPLVAYFGGVIAVHLLHHEPLVIQIATEVFVWTAAALRFPELPRRLFY